MHHVKQSILFHYAPDFIRIDANGKRCDVFTCMSFRALGTVLSCW